MAGTYPDTQVPRARSTRQQFWLEHLRAWQTQGTSLRAYAAANGLSSSSLYRARRRLERRGVLSESNEAAPAFVPVRVALSAPACRALLPNGVVVEVPEQTERAMCATVLECASRLRWSPPRPPRYRGVAVRRAGGLSQAEHGSGDSGAGPALDGPVLGAALCVHPPAADPVPDPVLGGGAGSCCGTSAWSGRALPGRAAATPW